MNIKGVCANHLCNTVVRAFANWSAVSLALQCGGFEWRSPGPLLTAIEKWLDEWGGNFYLLPEYRTNGERIDIALVGPRSFNRCTLDVKTVIEVKGNFASQVNKNNAGEIGRQLDGALEQVRQYKNHTGARFGYVLHLIASPETDDNFAEEVRDGGWRYWREDGLGTMWSALERLDRHVRDNGIRVEGFAELDRPTAGQYFYCYLAKC